MPREFNGKLYKELFCLNTDCYLHLGYFRKQNEKPGFILLIICRRCGVQNEWRFGYSEIEEQFDKVKEVVEMKGGEN